MRQAAIYMMDYVDPATTNILSPDILPMADLSTMLRLPSTSGNQLQGDTGYDQNFNVQHVAYYKRSMHQ